MTTKKTAPTRNNPLALGLWVVVGSGLIYGVTQTAIKAAALFTG
ncbi:MFS transporter small subunit [Demequina sp. SO4-18]